MTAPSVLTVGHSNHSIERFLEVLRQHDVTALADVRSQPYSRFNPQFSRKPLAETLRKGGIAYVFLGRELGARSSDPTCYENGRVQYRRLAATTLFKDGLQRVVTGAQDHRIVLLCAEKEPLACHRTLLVSRELEAVGVRVEHIHADGALESHGDAMTRLIHVLGMPATDVFRTKEALIADAYEAQEKRIAYVSNDARVGTG